MKALVMAAGVGSRLEPITQSIPKPLVPINGKPVMQYNIELLKKHGFTDITANLHYFPEQIKDFFGDGSKFGVKIKYSFEEVLLGTAGGVKKMASIAGISKNEAFLVMSSDILTNIDLSALSAFHLSKKALATLALAKVADTEHYGVVITDPEGRITAFQEKPKKGEELSNCVNTGIYIFEAAILDMIPENTHFDFGKQLFPKLVRDRLPFFGFDTDSYWIDVGNLNNYKKADSDARSVF